MFTLVEMFGTRTYRIALTIQAVYTGTCINTLDKTLNDYRYMVFKTENRITFRKFYIAVICFCPI